MIITHAIGLSLLKAEAPKGTVRRRLNAVIFNDYGLRWADRNPPHGARLVEKTLWMDRSAKAGLHLYKEI